MDSSPRARPQSDTRNGVASCNSAHASMSEEWREVATEHRGISTWLEPVEVPVTTLDALVAEHGPPAFCKIDVEGFEYRVLSGLSESIPVVAFEFHRETIEEMTRCVGRLGELGDYRLAVFVDEWPDRISDELAPEKAIDVVEALPPGSWGMVLARLVK